MAVYVPCTPADSSRWTQRTSLAGREYVLTFDWIERQGQWRLSLADQDGDAIRDGVALVTGRRLLKGVIDDRRPAGELVVVDAQGRNDLDPGYADLGTRFQLVYFDPLELPPDLIP